jgi:radical SAM-linked protein
VKGGAAHPIRLEYAKRGKVRWISHRDVARAFERAFRIEQLPLAFTEGFSPHPKISFGLALSTGHESDAEYLDVELREVVDLGELSAGVTEALPGGMSVTGAVALAERAPALQESVTAAGWLVDVVDEHERPLTDSAVGDAVDALMAAPTVEVMKRRKGREGIEDIRPLIVAVEVVAGSTLRMDLATRPKAIKPADVLAAFAVVHPEIGELTEARVVRTHQWIERDGVRLSPLVADARPPDADRPEESGHVFAAAS